MSRTNRYARYESRRIFCTLVRLVWVGCKLPLRWVRWYGLDPGAASTLQKSRARFVAGCERLWRGYNHLWSVTLVLALLSMLILLGAFDNISVVIRSTLLLVRTPDAMRGRVSAVSSLFIGTSNQLGGFESGADRAIVGPVPAVALGGIGTLLVVTLVAMCSPEIRRLGTLRGGAVEN